MKSVHIYGAGDLRIDDKAIPAIGDHDVLVQVSACGICGSDASFVKTGSFYGADTPMPLGHEFVGVIHSKGQAVDQLNIGDRVVVNPMLGDSTIGCGGQEQGAFSEYVRVPVRRDTPNVFVVPDTVPDDIAALCEPIAVATHAVQAARIQPGERAVIFGAGPIGLGAVVRLKYLGINDISVIDFSDFRLAIARQLGALRTHNPGQGKTSTFLREQLGTRQSEGGNGIDADVFIEAAGAAPALQDIIKLAPYRARIVIVAMHAQPVPLDVAAIMGKELTLCGSIGYPDEFGDVVAMVARLNRALEPMITHRFPLSQFHTAFATALQAGSAAKVIVHCQQ